MVNGFITTMLVGIAFNDSVFAMVDGCVISGDNYCEMMWIFLGGSSAYVLGLVGGFYFDNNLMRC
jgi:hypothetical protein